MAEAKVERETAYGDLSVQVVREGRRRYYRVVGSKDIGSEVELPTVTTILNAMLPKQLTGWAAEQVKQDAIKRLMPYTDGQEILGADVLKAEMEEARKAVWRRAGAAADVGKDIHAALEMLARDEEPVITDVRVQNAISAYQKWQEKMGMRVMFSEMSVFCACHMMAGTLDAIAYQKRGDREFMVALDWKSSNGIYDDFALQLSAYHHMLVEMGYQEFVAKDGYIVRFGKDKPEFESRQVKDLFRTFETFEHVRHSWLDLKEHDFDGWGDVELWTPDDD
jgi:hypothetical protein